MNEIAELVGRLSELSRADLVEIFYKVFDGVEDRDPERKEFVDRKLVLAEASWEEIGVPVEIYIACPSGGFFLGGDRLTELARCTSCKVLLRSAFKEVICPVCRTPNGLT